MASRLSASVAKRASQDSISRQAEGATQQADPESAQRILRSTSPQSQLPVRASTSKVRVSSTGNIGVPRRMRTASTASTTSIITQSLLTSPALATTGTSAPETVISGFSSTSGAPGGSAATTLQAATDLATPSVKSASWFTSRTKPKNVSLDTGGMPPSTSTTMLSTPSVNVDAESTSIEPSVAPVMSVSPEAQLPTFEIQPPTPALSQGPNMALDQHLPAIFESNPGSPPSSPSPASLPSNAASTSPSPQPFTPAVIHGTLMSNSTPVSPTLHSRASTPPPASASTSAIAVPKPKRSWFGSPSRPATPASRPQSRTGSAPASPSKPSLVRPRVATTPERSITPAPAPPDTELDVPQAAAPRPSTPPPVYPLALQLDVDTVVDRDAMRAPPPGGEDAAGVDEEPPVYTASERATGARSRVVSATVAAAPSAATAVAQKETKAPPKRASPGSVDDTVPSLPHTPTEEGAGAGGGSSSGSSRSGGGAARFVLSLPLLGRAKLPLGVMLGASGAGSVPADLERESSPSLHSDSSTTPPVEDGPVVANAVKEDARDAPAIEAGKPSQVQSMQGPASPNSMQDMADADRVSRVGPASRPEGAPHTDAHAAAGASWWNYVGWTAASTTSSPPQTDDATASAPAPEAAGDSPDALEPVQGVDTPSNGTTPVKEEEGAKEANEAPPVQAGEARNGDEQNGVPPAQQVATWYAPWAWYSPSPSRAQSLVAAEDTASAVASPVPDAVQEPQPSANLPLPDPDPPTLLPPVESGLAIPPALVWEPETTITTSLSNWAAYFTARSRVKMLGGRTIEPSEVIRDSNGMEVMEVDFEDDTAPDARGRTDSAGAPTGNRLLMDRSRSTSRAPRQGSPAPGGAAPNARVTTTTSSTLTTATMSSTTTTTSAPPSRPSSPAPAYPKKPPAAPAPPNLVLPTWADTFFVAPRSVLPPRAPSPPTPPPPDTPKMAHEDTVLSKTLKLVGSVLFATGAPAPSAPPSPSSPSSPSSRRHPHHTTRPSRLARVASASSGVTVQVDSDESEGEGLDVLERHRQAAFRAWGQELPKAWRVLQEGAIEEGGSSSASVDARPRKIRRRGSWGSSHGGPERIYADAGEEAGGMHDVLRGCRRVVVIGIHGWFPGAMIRTVLGEPTGTSSKFANMTEQALHAFEAEHGVHLEKITKIPLEGDGTIERRVDKLYTNLLANPEWIADLHAADAIIVATHSQGSIVSTHLLDRLIRDGHIVTRKNVDAVRGDALKNVVMAMGEGGVGGGVGAGADGTAMRRLQRVCCLALCGIHLGPLRYLSSSTLVGPYLQYFESTAARELFEFQNTDSAVSKAYVAALENVVNHGTKIVYVASLNDQVVPIYSGLFTAVSHPLILRALYIDGDAYHSSDFLSNLLVLLLRILNAGIPDSGLLAHLSEATAGSLNGVGHSAAYEELATYSLAVKYLFLTNEGAAAERALALEPFNATHEQNDYEIPWALRDVIADARVAHFFGREIGALRDAFREWHPKTAILRDLKRKLQPITRLPTSFSMAAGGGNSSLLGGSKL
ncbi:hypothetical protein HYPSUDRAFT_38427 [Hypholoma sublateritium FD-334 SS-4]|uniref:YMC020W-like alpha/beta hydrolase domain-containing protein n=1 Tax=Hypholoma sublateritium (strain FD-334 SS-4) TaxID=945553 RepID=A0A0D2P1J3_HYPSF|nr:hypothetical protein HYPSUDRAFT_38427 [Hypholoma sublateritium FD-334 SS-4]